MTASARSYRPDIDGLRAIAISTVVLYHAGLPPFTGGFIGVDVFFVISGYLITGIISSEIAGGRFTIAGFYERRIRRIFPALVFTIVLTVVAALALMTAVDLRRVFDALTWLGIFASNVYFMQNTGYFDAATEHHPFLQTWSLAIEEQFYVVFPLALVALHRQRLVSPRVVVAVAALASLLFSIAIVDRDVRTAFFSAPGRAWELLLGSLLAMGALPALNTAWLRQLVSMVGLALILGSALVLTRDSTFPGVAALPPCLGALMIIWAGQDGQDAMVTRALGLRPFVFIGLISYSLYLVHWPLFAFAHGLVEQPALWLRLSLVVGAVLVAMVSWRFIETPFRRPAHGTSRRTLFVIALAIMATTSLGSYAGSVYAGRNLGKADAIAQQHRDHAHADTCMLSEAAPFDEWPSSTCTLPGKGARVLVWGDSYAQHYYDGFREWASQTGRPLTLVAKSSCPPIPGLATPNRKACAPFNDRVMEKILAERPGTVVISASWLVNEKKRSIAESFDGKLQLLNTAIDRMSKAGIRVVVLGPAPVFPSPVPQIVASEAPGADGTAQASISRLFDRFFRDLEAKGRIAYLSAWELFCTRTIRCRYRDGKDWLFWDEGHLTSLGGKQVVKALVKKVGPL